LPAHLRTSEVLGTLSYDDSTSYRSRFLRVLRANDQFGNPIRDVEYYGYDDNGTPEDYSDDQILYLLRSYILQDGLDTNAFSGVVRMYDPDMVERAQWNIASLYCVDDDDYDGLNATVEGKYHSIIIPVQRSLITSDQPYRFVLHFVDNHAEKYRNDQKRPALDLNQQYILRPTITIAAADRQYRPDVGNETNVTISIVDAGRSDRPILTDAAAPITVTVSPSRLRGICTNYKIGSDPNEWDSQHNKNKVDFTWTKVGEQFVDDDRSNYTGDSLTKVIYSTKSRNIPAGALTYSGGTCSLTLKSYDYGGRVKIQPAGSNAKGAFPVESTNDPMRNTNQSRAYLYVPEDFDEDRLLDSWETSQPAALGFSTLPNNPGDNYNIGQHNDYSRDNDRTPETSNANPAAGDGFWAFEEYRGIMHQGIWECLDPDMKELVVRTYLDVGNLVDATGLSVIEVSNSNNDEMGSDNRVAMNCTASSSDDWNILHAGQNGIRIRDAGADSDPSVLGRATWGTPNDADYEHCVRIYTTSIAAQFPNLIPGVTTHVITHECCHDLRLTIASIVDSRGFNHHPNDIGCVMDRSVGVDNYQNNDLCDQDCSPAVQPH
jgi:hypothetical protein